VFVFLRFYDLEHKTPFAWDQTSNAWMMRQVLVEHKFPLEGMVAKASTGFYIGPGYYYLLAPFYWAFQRDPIAAPVFAGFVAIASFWVFYLTILHMFSKSAALWSAALHTVSFHAIVSSRVPWPVIFIPMVSLGIFYSLYLILQGKPKALLLLAALLGFSFHIHFTAVYFLLIVGLLLPAIVRKAFSIKYILAALGVFILFFIPQIIVGVTNSFSSGQNALNYTSLYYHGFHLRRMMQLLPDAFIQFEGLLFFRELRLGGVVILPLFLFVLWYTKHKTFLWVAVLSILWILVPWLVMTLYSGEISEYYFASTLPVAIMSIGFLFSILSAHRVGLVIALGLFGVYATFNIQRFLRPSKGVLPVARKEAMRALEEGRAIDFSEGDPASYLYDLYKGRAIKQ
jgi:4-amino-4-deoxy-L-arabinose transferase-like glycosyltransferase